jgi:hypothetical protein
LNPLDFAKAMFAIGGKVGAGKHKNNWKPQLWQQDEDGEMKPFDAAPIPLLSTADDLRKYVDRFPDHLSPFPDFGSPGMAPVWISGAGALDLRIVEDKVTPHDANCKLAGEEVLFERLKKLGYGLELGADGRLKDRKWHNMNPVTSCAYLWLELAAHFLRIPIEWLQKWDTKRCGLINRQMRMCTTKMSTNFVYVVAAARLASCPAFASPHIACLRALTHARNMNAFGLQRSLR